jgi:ATP-binding cassette subfamily B protein
VSSEAANNAFAKACAYLNYNAGAKWVALLSSIGASLLYVALLVLLLLFSELMVHRGHLPRLDELSENDKERFFGEWNQLDAEQRQTLLQAVSADSTLAGESASKELTARKQEILWRAYLPQILHDRVNEEAGKEAEQSIDDSLPDMGAISLVARSHASDRLYTSFVGWVVRWNPWMWKWRWLGSNFIPYLTGLFVLALVLTVLRAGLAFLLREAAARCTIEAATRMRRGVYHHTFRLGTLAFRALGPNEAVTIFTRHVEAIHEALYARLTVTFREPIKFFLLLGFALLVHPWLALAFLLFAVVVWLAGGQLAAYFRQQGRMASDRAAEQLALIRESLMLMRLVKVYMMELFNQSRVERLLARYGRAQLLRLRGEAVYRPLLYVMGMVAALILLYVAGLIVLHGRLGAASTVTIAVALVSLYWPVESWLGHRKALRRGKESALALFQFLERPGEVGQVVGAEFVPPMEQKLEFDNVTLREPGANRLLLQDVTLTIRAGQRVGLIGADDLEKHSLVYLIPRLLDPTSGEIRIDQHNLRWVTLDSLRNQIATVLQNDLLFHDTVANNIGCGDPQYTLPQIIEAAKIAHAHHFIQKLPKGYDTTVGELGHSLTTSQKFLIALARAILRDPAIFIIEEPDETLDEDTKSFLDDTYARFLPGRTTIFLPHRISTIKNCDKVFLLRNGKIEAEGEHRELLASNPLYRHLHYLEFSEVNEAG